MRSRRLLLSALCAIIAPATGHADDASDIAAARRFAEPVLGKACSFSGTADDTTTGDSHVYLLTYRSRGQDQDSPDHRRTLVQLACAPGADNPQSIYLMRDEADGRWEILAFAEPLADYDYADENFTRLKAPPRVVGFVTATRMANSEYIPQSRTIRSYAKWRGIGDAWSSGEWQFDDGVFVLRKYEMDPTYRPPDGEEEHADMPESYVLFDAEGPAP